MKQKRWMTAIVKQATAQEAQKMPWHRSVRPMRAKGLKPAAKAA